MHQNRRSGAGFTRRVKLKQLSQGRTDRSKKIRQLQQGAAAVGALGGLEGRATGIARMTPDSRPNGAPMMVYRMYASVASATSEASALGPDGRGAGWWPRSDSVGPVFSICGICEGVETH